jgi:hypothetical protein
MDELTFGVVAWSCVRYSLDEIERIRKKPSSDFPAVVTPAFFKHSDEQTIASVGAIVRAIHDFEMPIDGFQSWSIAAAPRFMGRTALAAGMHRYEVDGPWGTSVQAVPHRSQHSVASTLSLMLGTHGPCIGAGSGHGSDTEVLLTAVSLLDDEHSEGTWLVMSGFDPELEIDRAGKPIADTSCVAVALALAPGNRPCHSELRFNVTSQTHYESGEQTQGPLAAMTQLLPRVGNSLRDDLSCVGGSSQGVRWELSLRAPQQAAAAMVTQRAA